MISLWKKILSRFVDLPLERASTAYNPELELHLRNGRYLLSTPNAIYSYGDLYINFYEAFKRMKPHKSDIEEVLVLGMGLGSIPWMLEKNFGCNFKYTCVEVDEVVAGWAMKYVVPELRSHLTIYTADAIPFVHACQQRFDLVCVDLFLDNHVPHELDHPDFTARLAELLSKNGLLMWNRLADRDALIQRTENFYENVFSKIFQDAHLLVLENNWMLFSRNPQK